MVAEPRTERLTSKVAALVSPEMVARGSEPYARGFVDAINHVLAILAETREEGLPYLATMLAAWYDAFGDGDGSLTYYALTNDRVSKLRDAIRFRIDHPASQESR